MRLTGWIGGGCWSGCVLVGCGRSTVCFLFATSVCRVDLILSVLMVEEPLSISMNASSYFNMCLTR